MQLSRRNLTPSTSDGISLWHYYKAAGFQVESMMPLGTSSFEMVAFARQAVLDGDFASREDGVLLAPPLFILLLFWSGCR